MIGVRQIKRPTSEDVGRVFLVVSGGRTRAELRGVGFGHLFDDGEDVMVFDRLDLVG
jgi:hypothetical protein